MGSSVVFAAFVVAIMAIYFCSAKLKARRFDARMLVESDPAKLWAAFSKTIDWHDKHDLGSIGTANRIWRKHPAVEDIEQLPVLTEENVSLTCQRWTLPQLETLLQEKLITAKLPRAIDYPIVVICWNGRNYMVDGRRRVNYFVSMRIEGPHDVLVIRVLDR